MCRRDRSGHADGLDRAVGMEFELSKIDAAVEQLDWAIRLLLDHQAYLPAITLAGAAEEILGQAVGDRAAFAQLKTVFAGRLRYLRENHFPAASE
jgi:hypothetical protein